MDTQSQDPESSRSIDKGGGAYVEGGAQASGDFIGRDKIIAEVVNISAGQVDWERVDFTVSRFRV